MVCPHCNYAHGWSSEQQKDIKGDMGKFFELEGHSLKRESGYSYSTESRNTFGCPSCNKLFMD